MMKSTKLEIVNPWTKSILLVKPNSASMPNPSPATVPKPYSASTFPLESYFM